VVLVGPKEDVRLLRPELGIDSGGVIAGRGGVAVGVTGADPIGLVVVGILTNCGLELERNRKKEEEKKKKKKKGGGIPPSVSLDLRSALAKGLLCAWSVGCGVCCVGTGDVETGCLCGCWRSGSSSLSSLDSSLLSSSSSRGGALLFAGVMMKGLVEGPPAPFFLVKMRNKTKVESCSRFTIKSGPKYPASYHPLISALVNGPCVSP
jgi:hypothetical protein